MFAYLDTAAGIAGDMLLGALVDAGLSPRELEAALKRAVPGRGWKLRFARTERRGWPAQRFQLDGDRYFGDPRKMIRTVQNAPLPEPVKNWSREALELLERAEAGAHRSGRGDFDRDGLGLLDTFVDVVGCSWGFWRLGLKEVVASPINTGRLAPAGAWIAKTQQIPIFSQGSPFELATPTGMALAAVLCDRFGPLPLGPLTGSGFGAGHRDTADRPNVLGLHLRKQQGGSLQSDSVLLLETNIDDMDPRLYPHVMDRLFAAGALDAWWTSIGMKKGRPGILFSVLCRPEHEKIITSVLFQETTTLGVRRFPLDRWTLPRVTGGYRKIAYLPDGQKKTQVEFEKARRRARGSAIPLRKLLK